MIVLLALFGLVGPGKGLNLGIEFEGGVEYRVAMTSGQANQANVEKIRDAVAQKAADANIPAAESPIVNTSGSGNIRVQTEPLTNDAGRHARQDHRERRTDPGHQPGRHRGHLGSPGRPAGAARARRVPGAGGAVHLGVLPRVEDVRGRDRRARATTWSSPSASTRCPGSRSRPATVTGILTILGFSLYDTVVVFDKVRENTKNLARTRQTYAEAANLAVNQTLVRSINTSIVALLPVGALLYVGVVSLGSGALKDLALALFVGMAAGAYSSIFIATPLVVQLKEREPGVKAGDARALRHRTRKSVDPFASCRRSPRTCRCTTSRPTTGTALGTPTRRSTRARRVPAPRSEPEPVATPPVSVPASRPVRPSASAKRAQPSRKPRSQRGKP